MPRGQVLDRDAVRLDHVDAVGELVPPVDDAAVAIFATDGDVRRRDHDRLVVDACRDQHHPARLRVIDRFLDGREIRRHVNRRGEPGRHRLASRSHLTTGRARDRRVAHDDDAGHPHARRSVVLAEVRVHARLIERRGERRIRRQVAGIERSVVRRDGVRAVPVVGPLDRLARLDADDPGVERVVDGADLRVVVTRARRERRSQRQQHREPDRCQTAHHRPGP